MTACAPSIPPPPPPRPQVPSFFLTLNKDGSGAGDGAQSVDCFSSLSEHRVCPQNCPHLAWSTTVIPALRRMRNEDHPGYRRPCLKTRTGQKVQQILSGRSPQAPRGTSEICALRPSGRACRSTFSVVTKGGPGLPASFSLCRFIFPSLSDVCRF